jgi:gluconolactonase
MASKFCKLMTILVLWRSALLLTPLFGAIAVHAEPRVVADPALTAVEDILREGGATPAEIASFEEDSRAESAEGLKNYAEALRGLSAEALHRVVQNMGYDLPYVLTADSRPQAGVPKGKTFMFTLEHSNVFPGTTHRITVYVPAEYRADRPACAYVGLDELGLQAPTVFDNLIARHEIPVTIGIGVAPGVVDSVSSPQNPRLDRSREFDGLSDELARFLLEEVFPEVQRHNTPDGLPIRLSDDPNDRAAGGVSTGGIAAFTLAWERPDAFRRVFTASGTFVGMRGGDRYPVLVRKTEPKPIRIFMQDGSHDGLDDWFGEVGGWWMENQTLERALTFSGYQVEHVWGEGPHGSRQGRVVFPDAMRWLWRDWPRPITAGQSNNNFLKAILQPGEGWEKTPTDDAGAREVVSQLLDYRARAADGRSYETDVRTGEVWLVRSDGKRQLVDRGLKGPTGAALSPDGLWLAVEESATHFGYSYRVKADGTLEARQRFYWFHTPDDGDDAGAAGWVYDEEGRLYAATRMGVQVFDRGGRSRAILPLPDRSAATGITFRGADFGTLYVGSADHKVYRRKLNVRGVAPGAAPIRLPPPTV